ncbi:MAG: monovalent cation/H(+) antiporter subunit G [Pseudomonadota bacterium]
MLAVLQIVAGVLVFVGAVFSLLAAIGILRFPDVYSRMHAASKAGTVGSGAILLALAILAPDIGVATRALAGIAFFLLTAPIAAHLLARVAYTVGIEMWDGSVVDDLKRAPDEPFGSKD